MIRLNVHLDEQLHKELKVFVAQNSLTIQKFVVDAIKEKIEKEEQKINDKQ